MNVMVMDVEGTDGRERGEDQVRLLVHVLAILRIMDNFFFSGFRAQIRVIFAGIVRNTDR